MNTVTLDHRETPLLVSIETRLRVPKIEQPELVLLRKSIVRARFGDLELITALRGNDWEVRLHSNYLQRELGGNYPANGFFGTYSFLPGIGYTPVLLLGSRFCDDVDEAKLDAKALFRDIMNNGDEIELEVSTLGINDPPLYDIRKGLLVHRYKEEKYQGSELHLPPITGRNSLTRPIQEYYEFAHDYYMVDHEEE